LHLHSLCLWPHRQISLCTGSHDKFIVCYICVSQHGQLPQTEWYYLAWPLNSSSQHRCSKVNLIASDRREEYSQIILNKRPSKEWGPFGTSSPLPKDKEHCWLLDGIIACQEIFKVPQVVTTSSQVTCSD
jgi:hypothetical protein